MTNKQPEQAKANTDAGESVKQKGLSKEAWAAVSAIAVALISGAVAIITTIIPKLQIDQPSTGSSRNPENPPSQTLDPSSSASSRPLPPSATQALLAALKAANIHYSVSEAQILSWLGNPGAEYLQVAQGCLTLLNQQRLKNRADLDVIVYGYKKVSGLPVEESLPLNHAVNLEKLKSAIVIAYNDRHSPSAQSFAEIVEPK